MYILNHNYSRGLHSCDLTCTFGTSLARAARLHMYVRLHMAFYKGKVCAFALRPHDLSLQSSIVLNGSGGGAILCVAV